MITYTKETLITKLNEIRSQGWHKNVRGGNVGGVGNTLETLLGIVENNLPIPNAAEWELKCQRIGTAALTTLFHMEPSPTALHFVPQIFLPLYGWSHQTIAGEMSFRQTINAIARSDRGFKIVVDRRERKILVSFDASVVSERHAAWLANVKKRAGVEELNPQPYWGFNDLFHKAGTKLHNCFYVQAQVKKEGKDEYYLYEKIMRFESFSLEKFIDALEAGTLLVDFDARTGHNHGTKFRLRQNFLIELYEHSEIISC